MNRKALLAVTAALLAIIAVVSLATLAGNDTATQHQTAHTKNLVDISSVAKLRARFNRDVGKPRLLVLFSPT